MRELLYHAVEKRIFRHLDMQFAMLVAGSDEPEVMLAAAILSRDAGEGHVCLPINQLVSNYNTPVQLQACFAVIGKTIDWTKTLLCSSAVSNGESATPMILSKNRLYLNRMWRNEQIISSFFNETNQPMPYDKILLIKTLNELFEMTESFNWQKVAVALSLTRRISIISGGPGTGKTTTIAKLLTALIQMAGEQKIRIGLAAPTGKAAARLTESLNDALQYLPLTNSQRKKFPEKATTIHRLLGVHPESQYFSYHSGNPLHLDVLVIDEASMIDLTMMSRLISALPLHARVIFLGDRDQLGSVEAGSVLRDICSYANKGFTTACARELQEITGFPIDGNPSLIAAGMMGDSICLLQKSYRFGISSGISQLAISVNRGDYPAIKKVFNSGFVDIRKMELKTNDDYLKMIKEAIDSYRCFLYCVQKQHDPEKVLETFSQFRLLCALREGPFGVTGINNHFEKLLLKTKNINPQSYSRWYEGRPVIISRNDITLGLCNGDIGVALNRGNGLRIWFQMPDGNMKSIQPSRLPEHETAWVMTVHKSQGSEFDHVALILPPIQSSPIITRELIYTAITRARKRLSLYTNDQVLAKAVVTCIERRSGLKDNI